VNVGGGRDLLDDADSFEIVGEAYAGAAFDAVFGMGEPAERQWRGVRHVISRRAVEKQGEQHGQKNSSKLCPGESV